MKSSSTAIFLTLLTTLLWWSCGSTTTEAGTDIIPIDTTVADTATAEVRLASLTERLKYGPENWRLWLERSEVLYEMNNMPRAMADIDNAIKYSVTEPETYYLRGFYYYVQKNDSAALRDFERAADLNSENPETYYQIGNIYFFRKGYEKAEEAYDHAILLDSLQPTYVFAKGLMRQQQGQIDQAITYYNDALKCDPTFIKGLLALHDVYLEEKKNPDQAYTYNERVMLIDSTQPLAHFNQGNFFMVRASKVTDTKKEADFQVLMKIAIAEYSTCLKYDPNFIKGIYNRGYAYHLIGKQGSAVADFSRIIELDPFHRDAFYMKANIQEYEGELSDALQNYQRALEIDPNFADAATAVKELTIKLKAKEKKGS
jgi:tetratricopeptide (TPR) repeat protein